MKVSTRESEDRMAALSLEREKWEHERDKPMRGAQRECLSSALTSVRRLRQYMFECHKDPAQLQAMEGGFHKVRIVSSSLNQAATDLIHHGLSEEAQGVFDLMDFFGNSVPTFEDHYSDLFAECIVVSDVLESRLGRTYE